MTRLALLAALVLVFTACPLSKDEPVQLLENQATAGARLRPQFVRGQSLRLFRGWRDTARGEDCRFLKAADGALRCLPGPFASTVFADDQCTEPAAVVAAHDACATPSVARQSASSNACDERTRVVALGAPVPLVHFALGDSCIPFAIPSGDLAFRVASEVDPVEFVAARREAGPAGQGLAVTRLVAEDGAIGQYGLQDAEGLACFSSRQFGSTPRCVPSMGVAFGLAWGDEACSKPTVYPGPCPVFAHVVVVSAGASEVWSLGAAAPRYEGNAGACVLVDASPTAARLLGPAVPVERFVAGTSASAGERLRLEVTLFTGVGLPSSLTVPRDAAWSSGTCLPYPAADGALRCLPPTPGAASPLPILLGRSRSGSTYADAECTVPLAPEGAATVGRLDPSPACPRMVRAFRTGVPHTGDVYTGAPGACTRLPAGTSGYALLGDEIPPAAFVPMTLE